MNLKVGDRVRFQGNGNQPDGTTGVIADMSVSWIDVKLDVPKGNCRSDGCWGTEQINTLIKIGEGTFKIGDKVLYIGRETPWARGLAGTIMSIDGSSVPYKVDYGAGRQGWAKEKNIELIKELTNMEKPKKVYKVMRLSEGKLKSVYAGNYAGAPFMEHLKGVIYKEGEVAYAPEGQACLATWDTLEQAKYFATHNKQGDMVIHEVVPLGERRGALQFEDVGSDSYPALLIGKEVWRDKPTRPEPKFKVGDKVVNRHPRDEGEQGLVFIIEGVEWAETSYGGHAHYHYSLVGHAPFDESWLELAPKEEWVDVTEECLVIKYGVGSSFVAEITRNGRTLGYIGYDGFQSSVEGDANYKIEAVREWSHYGGKKNHWFKVLHKETK